MRAAFQDELDQIGSQLVSMSRLVAAAMSKATTALLDADVSLAESVITADEDVDNTYRQLEERAFDLLARQAPVARDLRIVVTSLRMVADLERMGDLALHVAKVARMRFPERAVPPELHDTIRQMGQVAGQIVSKAGETVATRDVTRAAELEADDDIMDGLHRQLFATLLSDEWPYGVETAIDITLLGRYYERFADHAVSVARRVVYLVTGEWPESLAGLIGR